MQASCVALKQCAYICAVVVSRFLRNHHVESVFTQTLSWHCVLCSKNDAETVYLCAGVVDGTQTVHLHLLYAGIASDTGTVYLQYMLLSNDAETV